MIKLIKFFLVVLGLSTSLSIAQSIRPIRDNVGYCWNAKDMNTLMSYLSEHDSTNFPSKNLIAAISPHDDYLYASPVYYPLYKLIKAKVVIVFGVTHGTVRKALNDPKNVLIFDDFKYWHGPYKNVEVSGLREIIKNNLNKDYVMLSDTAQIIEHSIEGLIPFLQYYNRNVKIVPIMVTEMSYGRADSISTQLAGVISKYVKENNLKLGKDIFFLISNDANHYGEDFDNTFFGLDAKAHREATDNDKLIAKTFNSSIDENRIENISRELWLSYKQKKYYPLWCGRYPIVFGLLTTYKIVNDLNAGKLEGKVFKYSDSWTLKVLPLKGTHMGTTAPFSLKHWVGYLSAGFYLN
jgi:MEMO1 family protein